MTAAESKLHLDLLGSAMSELLFFSAEYLSLFAFDGAARVVRISGLHNLVRKSV